LRNRYCNLCGEEIQIKSKSRMKKIEIIGLGKVYLCPECHSLLEDISRIVMLFVKEKRKRTR